MTMMLMYRYAFLYVQFMLNFKRISIDQILVYYKIYTK